MGLFIDLEGLDGCGKTTQTELLCKKLEERGVNFKKIKLPDYENESSILVRKYLRGDFGKNVGDVNAYAASLLYSVDRFASFTEHWKSDYLNGTLIISDRYTPANAIYQITKLEKSEWDSFLDWLFDIEYNKIGIPAPDKVIFLDMPVSVSQKLMTERYHGDEKKKDVHEANVSYLNHCRDAALYVAKKYNWIVIDCAKNGEPLSIEEINGKILDAVLSIM
ncbi:MAG: deoxynucleoside kinase [Oscillospiraceae bacterium]|nr:deoxynucleoside kinase [Oscillospiraceae bacterium]MDD7469736.1 deoxynucleoside kinase [Oscillospiraceae bacterium]MDO4397507.1 deoxynucleoside kinase [Oscillospiraceae bacterium]MDY2678940.1 thymidylate kinase [Oscillospiraceae bacterium]